jgi:TolA-binding protein
MKKIIVLLLGLLLAGNTLAEEEKKAEEGLLDALRKKIEILMPKKKLQTTTAVGGVRGSKADANDLYWKGEKGEEGIDADELAAFDEALSLAEAGEMNKAEKQLVAFIKNYPGSQLREDAEQALVYVKERVPLPKPQAVKN